MTVLVYFVYVQTLLDEIDKSANLGCLTRSLFLIEYEYQKHVAADVKNSWKFSNQKKEECSRIETI